VRLLRRSIRRRVARVSERIERLCPAPVQQLSRFNRSTESVQPHSEA